MEQWQKPALLIYRDGRTKITNQVFEGRNVKEWELWPHCSWMETSFDTPPTFPFLERTFYFIGVAGPYSVFGEV